MFTKTVHIHLDPDSVTKRMERVRGVAVHNVHETMHVVMSRWPKGLSSRSRQHYSGSTATNGLGPVALSDISSLWHVLWPVKQDMYGNKWLDSRRGGERPARRISRVKPKSPGHPPRHHPLAVPERASQ